MIIIIVLAAVAFGNNVVFLFYAIGLALLVDYGLIDRSKNERERRPRSASSLALLVGQRLERKRNGLMRDKMGR